MELTTQEQSTILEVGKKVIIDDALSLAWADAAIEIIKKFKKEIVDHHKPIINKAKDTLKQAKIAQDKYLEPAEEAEVNIKKEYIRYQRGIINEIADMDIEDGTIITIDPSQVAKNMSMCNNWKAEITDKITLLREIFKGQVPGMSMDDVSIDLKPLNKLAKGDISVPGVKFFNDEYVRLK